MRLQWFESAMDAANRLLHVFMALALLVTSILLIRQFVDDVLHTFRTGLWVLSSLISAEVRLPRPSSPADAAPFRTGLTGIDEPRWRADTGRWRRPQGWAARQNSGATAQ